MPPTARPPCQNSLSLRARAFGKTLALGGARAKTQARYSMKKLMTKTAAIAVLSAGAILAQGPMHHEMGGGGGSANPPDVATIVAHQVSFLTTLLTLTTGQQTQATTIFTNALNSITPLETGITAARTALSTAIKANDTAAITTQCTAIGTLEG